MKYCVNVPLDRNLMFPDVCPFTDAPAPEGSVRLERISNQFFIPLPGGYYHSYKQTSLRIPASRKFVRLETNLKIMMWVCLIGGPGLCAWLLIGLKGPTGSAPMLLLVGGPIVALIFRIARNLVLRPVRIQAAWNGFVEVRFRSEAYARSFSERNNLPLMAD